MRTIFKRIVIYNWPVSLLAATGIESAIESSNYICALLLFVYFAISSLPLIMSNHKEIYKEVKYLENRICRILNI